MIRFRETTIALAIALLFAFVPGNASAQLSYSIGGGVATPYGDFSDVVEPGYTIRGQLGLDMILVGLHGQVGYTRFPGADGTLPGGATFEVDDVSVYHYGVGGRLGMGLLWVGGTGVYFAGDGADEFGILPEVGVGFGPVEAVADLRVTGDEKWWSLRGAFRF